MLESVFDMDFYDNSIKNDSDWDNVDLIIFAGTPAWYGKQSKILYDKILELGIPCAFIGIGTGEPGIKEKLRDYELKALDKAKIITTRDKATEQLLKDFGAKVLPCPSILCSNEARLIDKVKKIGLIYSSSQVTVNNNISPETEQYMKILYTHIAKQYNCELICHYIEELDYVKNDFPDIKYHYSYDSNVYKNIYSKYDMIVGCRVHGIGIAASLGIPGIAIAHSIRSETVEHLGARVLHLDTAIDEAMSLVAYTVANITHYSERLADIKTYAKKAYTHEFESMFQSIKEDN